MPAVATQPPPPARQVSSPPFDLLRAPLVGPLLRHRRGRLLLQVPLLLLAAAMVLHGLLGPELAPRNLAALLTWVHYRGALVLVLLVAGNWFCYGCPFLLPRELARKLRMPTWRWPRALRGKWLAIALFVGVLFAYELFDLWGSPRWTAWLIVGYFAAALVVDALFRGAPFCKHVCPIGQFNFVASTASPLEVAVREPRVCGSCATKDCIRGRRDAAGAVERRGCELALFQPRKVGNLDCTFCLDCVHACPHDNVGVLARLPAEELLGDPQRSGVGRLGKRPDLAALALVFTFGALLNAFGMVSPVYALEQWMADVTGIRVEWPLLGALFVVALVLEPALLLGLAALASRRASGARESLLAVATRWTWTLVPLGFGVWLAHYCFHFLTGIWTVVPVAQAAVADLGYPLLGAPRWGLGGLPERVVYPMELGFLALGLLGSLGLAWRRAQQESPERARAVFAPWGALQVLLFATSIWLLSQPMEMRGTFLGG